MPMGLSDKQISILSGIAMANFVIEKVYTADYTDADFSALANLFNCGMIKRYFGCDIGFLDENNYSICISATPKGRRTLEQIDRSEICPT